MRHAIICTLIIGSLFYAPTLSTAEPWRDSAGETQTYDEVGRLAMEQVHWDWRPSGWQEIEFTPGRNGYLGMTFLEKRKISIWIRPEHAPPQVAATLVHELAHAFDYMYLTPELRSQWLVIRKLPPNTPWSPKSRRTDFSTGAGDFAESVRFTLQGSNIAFKSKLGPPPNKEQQELLRSWLLNLPKSQEQKQNCVRVKKPKGLSVFHHRYEENRDGQTVFVYRIEICEQPPLFWEVPENKVEFSNICTGVK